MPRIPGYEQQVRATSEAPAMPRQRAVGSGLADAGAAISNAAERLYDVAQRSEVSEVHARIAKARAEWTLALQERARTSDPGDLSFADKFTKDFGEYIAKTGEGFQTAAGQAAFKRGASDLSSHFVQSAGTYQAQAAGAKAKQDYLQSLDASRNTLLNDPSQFNAVAKFNADALADPNGPYARLSATEREQLKRTSNAELALSTVQGLARVNPTRAMADLNGGKWDQYLDADRKAALLQHVDVAIKARAADAERRAAAADRAQRREQMRVMDEVVKGMIDGTATAEGIRDANLDPSTKLRLVEMVRKQALEGEKIRTEPSVYLDVFQRIHLPDNDPRKIRDENSLLELVGNGLTLQNVRDFRSEIQGRRTEQGAIDAELRNGVITAAKNALTRTNPMLGIQDPKGDEQLQRFMTYFLPEFARQRQAGKTAAQLLDPDSPDYLGRAIDRFKRSPQQVIRDLTDTAKVGTSVAPTGAAPPVTGAPPTGGDPNFGQGAEVRQRGKSASGAPIYLVFKDGKYQWLNADGSAAK